jgi:hypothetical protein
MGETALNRFTRLSGSSSEDSWIPADSSSHELSARMRCEQLLVGPSSDTQE